MSCGSEIIDFTGNGGFGVGFLAIWDSGFRRSVRWGGGRHDGAAEGDRAPDDARLCHRALEKLADLAERNNVPLRQSYRRVAKRAAIMVRRHTHAYQFNRARRELKFLRTRLGRVIRDIRRKIPGNERLEQLRRSSRLGGAGTLPGSPAARPQCLFGARPPRWSASAKERRGRPYEFGCKVSIATPATKPKGGQFRSDLGQTSSAARWSANDDVRPTAVIFADGIAP